MIEDKIQPHATEMEELVLGALMLENCYSQIGDFIRAEMFYKQEHKIIYEAILELEKKDDPVDILTVTNQIKSIGSLDRIGGPYFIAQLTSRIGSAANVEYHARIVAEKWMKRELIRISEETLKAAYDEGSDIFDISHDAILRIEQMSSFKSNSFSPKERQSEAREAIWKAFQSPNGLSGVSTGYSSLDSFTGGLSAGDLIVVGGMPGTFKTALSLAILHNAERSGISVLMFEQEMSGRQVGMREIAMKTRISTESLKTGKVTETQLTQIEMAIGEMEDKRIFIDLSSGITTGRIKSIAKRMKKEEGIGLVVIDYLGLMNLEQKKYGGQEQAIDNTVKEIKVLAKTLDIPIMLLAQFSRESAKNPLVPPMMSYLKGSGAIEAHADACWLLWNPAQFDQNFNWDMGNGSNVNASGKLAIVHAKNRQGRVGMQWLNVDPATNTFTDINEWN